MRTQLMLGSFATPQMNAAWFLIVSLLNLASFPKVRSRPRFCQVAACSTVFRRECEIMSTGSFVTSRNGPDRTHGRKS
jgi:hypothetical protein